MERALYDVLNPATGVVNTVAMTHEEAIRCAHDFEFAMQIIAGQEATSMESESSTAATLPEETQSEAGATSSVVTEDVAVSTEISISAPPSAIDQETPGNTIYRWRESNILLLLNVYEDLKEKFADPKISQKKAWIMVAEEANKRNSNFEITGPQCMTKMRALKKIYKTIKDHNSKSGNDRKTWKYFEKMNDIFGTRAWATPIALVSSDQPPSNSPHSSSTSEINQSSPTPTRSRDKSTVIDLLKSKLEQRERHEAARQKRHEERLASDQALIQTIRDLFASSSSS